jgi:DNA processing protein
MLTQREQYILLNLIPEVGSTQWRLLLDALGGPAGVCAATPAQLAQAGGISLEKAQQVADGCRREQALREESAAARQHEVSVVTLDDPEYPQSLRAIYDPPLVLYIKGRLPQPGAVAIALVGSRHASAYGLAAAERLGYDLGMRGVTVVSGMARGIDGAAHRGALKAGGDTVAVLGNGLASVYPPEHASLAQEIAQHGGVLSEYPMRAQPLPFHFPRRYRVISGLCRGVVVVEAAAKSGALVTADCALEQGREVWAVPGPITTATSQGTHKLIKQGAALVVSAEDILESIEDPVPVGAGGTVCADGSAEARVLSCLLAKAPVHVDTISAHSGLPAAEVSSTLLVLEMRHLVQRRAGQWYVRAEPGLADDPDCER